MKFFSYQLGRTGPTGLDNRWDRLNLLYLFWAPQQLKLSLSLSLSLTCTLSLSRSLPPSLSPSSASPLPQTLDPKSSTPTWAQGQGGFKMAWSTFFSTRSSPGCPWFQVLRAENSHSRYSNLCRPDLSFYEVLSDFLWSIVSICIPSLGSKGVLIFVG